MTSIHFRTLIKPRFFMISSFVGNQFWMLLKKSSNYPCDALLGIKFLPSCDTCVIWNSVQNSSGTPLSYENWELLQMSLLTILMSFMGKISFIT